MEVAIPSCSWTLEKPLIPNQGCHQKGGYLFLGKQLNKLIPVTYLS